MPQRVCGLPKEEICSVNLLMSEETYPLRFTTNAGQNDLGRRLAILASAKNLLGINGVGLQATRLP